MSYFAAQVGQRDLPTPHPVTLWPDAAGWRITWPAPPLGVGMVRIPRGDSEPLAVVAEVPASRRWWRVPPEGGDVLGVAWGMAADGSVTTVTIPSSKTQRAVLPCPLCQGQLEWQARRWRCVGRCGAQWVSQYGQLVDVATLPHGLCECCPQAQPLLKGSAALICPVSQQPHGPTVTQQDVLTAIDAALKENQAKVGLFGLFNLE